MYEYVIFFFFFGIKSMNEYTEQRIKNHKNVTSFDGSVWWL